MENLSKIEQFREMLEKKGILVDQVNEQGEFFREYKSTGKKLKPWSFNSSIYNECYGCQGKIIIKDGEVQLIYTEKKDIIVKEHDPFERDLSWETVISVRYFVLDNYNGENYRQKLDYYDPRNYEQLYRDYKCLPSEQKSRKEIISKKIELTKKIIINSNEIINLEDKIQRLKNEKKALEFELREVNVDYEKMYDNDSENLTSELTEESGTPKL